MVTAMLLRLIGSTLIFGAGYWAALTESYWFVILSLVGYVVITSEDARR